MAGLDLSPAIFFITLPLMSQLSEYCCVANLLMIFSTLFKDRNES